MDLIYRGHHAAVHRAGCLLERRQVLLIAGHVSVGDAVEAVFAAHFYGGRPRFDPSPNLEV